MRPVPFRTGDDNPFFQERELQLTTADLNLARAESNQHQRSVRELQEQIQNDDRVERLESSLKHTESRADELAIRLSKLKQASFTNRFVGYRPQQAIRIISPSDLN